MRIIHTFFSHDLTTLLDLFGFAKKDFWRMFRDLLHELSLRDNKILNHIVTVTSSDIYRIIYIYI